MHQIRNEFLDFSYRQSVGRLSFHSTMVNAGLHIETLLGELHGAFNFQSALNDMWNSIQELSAHPAERETRAMLLATAGAFLEKAQSIYDGLVQYQHNLDQQVRQMVEEVNDTIAGIHRLNVAITAGEAAGDNANDFRDERNRLLDRLAEMIPIEVFTDPFGHVGIISQGHQLLSSGVQNRLGLRFISDDFSFVEPVVSNAPGILASDTPPSQFGRFVNHNRGIGEPFGNDFGQLNALLAARGTQPVTRMSLEPPNSVTPPHGPIADSHPDTIIADLNVWLLAPPAGATAAEIAAMTNRRDYLVANRDADIHNWNALRWSLNHAQIPQVQRNLDRIVFGVVNMMNDMLTGQLQVPNPLYPGTAGAPPYVPAFPNDGPPTSLCPDDDRGIPLFIRRTDTRPAWPTWVNAGVTVQFDPDDDTTWPPAGHPLWGPNSGPAIFNKDRPETWPEGVYIVENPGDITSIYSIRNLQINPAFFQPDGTNRLALSLSGAPDDQRLLLSMLNVWQSNAGKYAIDIKGRRFNVQDAYINFTSALSSDVAEANSFVASQTIQVQQASSLRLSIKGVSMDEELNAMLRFQFAFQSASRVFNVIDSMIETVIGIGR